MELNWSKLTPIRQMRGEDSESTAVRTGRALEEVFPVGAPPDLEHARMLESRVESLIRDNIPFAATE